MATSPHSHPILLFVDSPDRDAFVPWLRTGLFTGITTNPLLLRRAGLGVRDIPDIDARARDAGAREVCFQTWGTTYEELYANARRIREAAPEAVIKVPATPAGVRAISQLTAHDVPILLTAVHSAKQALIGSALGVRYIAPYFNRMLVAGRDALAEVRAMTDAIAQDGTGPLIMAASLKSAEQVVALSGAGVRVFTLSPDVIDDLFDDDLTAKAVTDFEDATA